MARGEFEHDIEPMVRWGRPPAKIDEQLGTVGRKIGLATAKEKLIVGLGASSYPRNGETHVRPFDGKYGVYKPGEDHRELLPGTSITGGKPVRK